MIGTTKGRGLVNRTVKYVTAGCIGVAVLSAEAFQSVIDPLQDLGIGTFVLNSTATAGPANGVTVQNAVTGNEIVIPYENAVKITYG